MRQEYIDKLLVLNSEERRCFENDQTFTMSEKVLTKEKYFCELHKNIRYIWHQRFCEHILHGHEFVEMMYVINGNITHVIDGKEISLETGDVIVMNKYVKHEVKKCFENDLALNFLFLPDFFDEVVKISSDCKNKFILHFLINILKDDKHSQYVVFKTKGNVAVENLFEILSLPYISKDYEVRNAQIITALIFKYFVDDYNIMQNEYSDKIIDEQIISYINNNYKCATLEDLSRQLCKSESTVSRYIKKMAGCNFNELVKRTRFGKAASLMIKTDMRITEIIHSVGYENSSYFYNEFKKRYDMSPRDYRRKNQK